jgi:hypothetical protein
MATALENGLYVRQKVRNALLAQNASPMIQAQFDAFFDHMGARQGGCPELQFVPFDGTDAEGANGQNAGIAAACTIYAVYGKKPRVAEDVFLALLDDASGAEGTTFVMSLGFPAKNGTTATLPQEDQAVFNSTGWPITAGVNVKAYTTVAGTTDTTAGAAPDGFYIIGA